MRRWTLLGLGVIAALAIGLVAAACGDGEEAVETPEPTETATATATGTTVATVDPNAPVIDVSLKEWSIEPSVGSIESGPVTFSASNNGTIPHELEIFAIGEDVDIANLPVEAEKAKPAEVGAEEIGEIEEEDLPGGGQAAATFALEPGRYLLICNIPSHYEAGMFAELTVE